MFNTNEKLHTKTDSNGLEYTTEHGFSDFCYEYLKTVGAATTFDILQHVRDNFDFLEGDEVKTSENRSAPRYRQMVDNLLKSHGTILTLYPDLRDFAGGIALENVEISEELMTRAKNEMSKASFLREQRRLEERERLRQQQKEINERADKLRLAKANASNWRLDIVKSAMEAGIEREEINEDFEEVIEDIVYRHPEAIENKSKMIEAFIAEF